MIRLFSELPNPQRRALDLVREVSAEEQLRPFLVGGPVRDLLLHRGVIDVDVTLEDGASTLARALAKRIDGRVRSFPQFLTYKVTAPALPEIDIATARKERYRQPGALPTVTEGRLKDDLLRRDFSINAIALDVMSGELHDPTGGEEDLRNGVVRVLHDESFLDDPTRIYRAIRLARRLNFRLDPHTEELMRAAIAGGALETVSKERIWRELSLAMEEADAAAVLSALADNGALAVLVGKREISRARLDLVQRELAKNPELDREVMYTATLLHGNASPLDLEGSGFSQKRARNVIQIANELPRFSDALSEATTDRQRFRILKHASPEMLSVVAAMQPDPVARFHEFRRFELPLRGNDLEVPGGPHIAKALERTREAVFTGEIAPTEARTFAREMAIKYLDHESK
jgi:tRNA nucleotidyltransferase/poly(A) polymerase